MDRLLRYPHRRGRPAAQVLRGPVLGSRAQVPRHLQLRGRQALRACLLVGARGRRPAREIATREPAARSGRSRSPARPCRRPWAPRPGPVVHEVPLVPSGQQGIGVSSRSMARPCCRPRAPRPGSVVHEVPLVPYKQQRTGVSSRSPARPCRRPRAPWPGLVVPPVPLVPSKQQGIGVSSRSPARPCRPRAPRPGPVVHEVPLVPSRQQGTGASSRSPARPCRRPRGPQSGRAVCTARHVPRFSLFLSGVTPLSGALHQLGGGVMPPNWCNPP